MSVCPPWFWSGDAHDVLVLASYLTITFVNRLVRHLSCDIPKKPANRELSYTTFELSNPQFAVQGDQMIAQVHVTNTGQVFGEEVIQFYVGFDHSSVERPKKLLRGFQKVGLKPGETRQVVITSPVERLCWYHPETGSWELEEMIYQGYIGTSSRDTDLLKGTFSLSDG